VTEHYVIGLVFIVVFGIGAQWLAWRLHLPSILLLLLVGLLGGPITGFLKPDELFGEVLVPFVSVAVAVILFEGGLSLRLRELRQVGGLVRNLITIGVLVTWGLGALAAHLVFGMGAAPALLLGAILVVTGPTVIIPLLRQVRPAGRVGSAIKWEGIVNDPVGAILAVLTFEVILLGGAQSGASVVLVGVTKAILVGGGMGLVGAAVMVLLLKKYLIPDFLHSPVALMMVILGYAAANALQTESGLLAVTVMGIALASQRYVSIKQILEFKENLRVILISVLFIILAARLPAGDGILTGAAGWVFVLVLILIVRPAAVLAATFRTALKRSERFFLAWMAPRGIVAAAVSSVFALRLAERDIAGYEALVPVTFQVIIGTVAVYGVSASFVARRLKVARPNPQGILIVGAHLWARAIAETLQREGLQVVLVDSNWSNVSAARSTGLAATYGNILSEDLAYDLPLDGIGRLIAVTPNDEVNSLAALHFLDVFGSSEVYQLPPAVAAGKSKQQRVSPDLRGRYLFSRDATFQNLNSRFRSGTVVKRNTITEEFNIDQLRSRYGQTALPLFVITESGGLRVSTADSPLSARPGQVLISLVEERE